VPLVVREEVGIGCEKPSGQWMSVDKFARSSVIVMNFSFYEAIEGAAFPGRRLAHGCVLVTIGC